MAITIKQIAELAGVSRGTVDRALYDRGRVSPEVAERIKKIAKEHGYKPNRAGRALALSKNPIKIGVIVQSVKTPFMKQVLEGIDRVREEVGHLGLQIEMRQIPSLDVKEQIKMIDELIEEGIKGLAILPVEDNQLQLKVNEIIEKEDIPVVTFNADIAGTKRMSFVGLNNYRSGQTVAGLMGMITGGKGKVLVITGYLSNRSHNERVEGFITELRKSYPEIQMLGVQTCFDEDEAAKDIAIQALKNEDLAGIFVVANGEVGVCQALKELGKEHQVRVIAHDTTPENEKYLDDGTIDFMIDQNALIQGYQPVKLLAEYLFEDKKPQKETYHTEILIKTKYNY